MNRNFRQVDEYANPVQRTKREYPYSYDEFVVWRCGKNEESNSTAYSDRLFQEDPRRHDELCVKHFGVKSQHWSGRNPKSIEMFLREFCDDNSIRLIYIMEGCHRSSGYPIWRFQYHSKKQEVFLKSLK